MLKFGEIKSQFCIIIVGITSLNLCKSQEIEGSEFRFVGIHSRNREEWAVTMFALALSGIANVPFFDSLG